jgi:hypothetical protein
MSGDLARPGAAAQPGIWREGLRALAAGPPTAGGKLVAAWLALALTAFLHMPETLVLTLPLALYAAWMLALLLRGAPTSGAPERTSDLDALSPRLIAALGAVTMVVCLALPPGNPPRPRGVLIAYDLAIAAQVASAVAAVRWARERPWLVGLLLALTAVAAMLIFLCPPTRIDVLALQQAGARALLSGADPYQMSIPNPYTPEETLAFFGRESRVLTHYPYPPLSLLLTALAYRIHPDVRFAYLALQLGIGVLLWRLALRSGAPPARAVALLALHLIHPRGLFVVQQAWTEPLLAFSFAALLWFSGRRGAAGSLAAFLAAKQHSVLLLPLLWRKGRVIGAAGLALAVAGAVALTLPFALWHPADFFEDVVLFQLQQPFRMDALSVPAALAWVTGLKVPGAVAPVVALGAALWARPRLPVGALGLALGGAFVYLCFFLAAKQAFVNYYYLVGVMLLLAAALQPAPGADAAGARSHLPNASPALNANWR